MTPNPENPKTHAKKHLVCDGPNWCIHSVDFKVNKGGEGISTDKLQPEETFTNLFMKTQNEDNSVEETYKLSPVLTGLELVIL